MQMMVDPQTQEAAYTPRHMRKTVIEVPGIDGLRKLVEQLPDGVILSVELQEVHDEQKDD